MNQQEQTTTEAFDDLDELEELLQESTEPGLDDLDSLLNESMALREEADSISRSREKLKRQNLSQEERRETEALVRAWEARRVWKTVADVTVWEETTCECGAVHRNFSHAMHKQTHRDNPETIRFIKADAWSNDLPTLSARIQLDIPICSTCAPEWDLNLDTPDMEWNA